MNTWKVILATLVIFGAGVVTGGLLVTFSNSVLHTPRRPARLERARVPVRATPPIGPLRMDFVDQLDRELKLTPAQRRHIERIIAAGQGRTRQLWQRIAPEVHAAMVETSDRIRNELTPAQRKRYAQLLRRLREQRRLEQRGRSTTNSPRPGNAAREPSKP